VINILVADDDKNTRLLMKAILEAEHYHVFTAADGQQALQMLDREHIDLVVLDIMMPNMDGYEFTATLRENNNTLPILMVSAKQLPEDKHRGFLVGTDDYITKPFRLGELCSRIRALLRRSAMGAGAASEPKQGMLCAGEIKVDLLGNRAYLAGQPLELTAAEYRLLCLFLNNAGRVLTRSAILDALWDGNGSFVDDNTLSVYIRRLREKVERDPSFPEHLLTVRGFGYQWKE